MFFRHLTKIIETLSKNGDEAVNDIEKYEFAFTRLFSDHCNSFGMENVLELPRNLN